MDDDVDKCQCCIDCRENLPSENKDSAVQIRSTCVSLRYPFSEAMDMFQILESVHGSHPPIHAKLM